MAETALDAIVERVGYYHSDWGYSLDGSTRTAKNLWPDTFSQAIQDPRYIQHCKEQDRKEEGPADWFKQSLAASIDANNKAAGEAWVAWSKS